MLHNYQDYLLSIGRSLHFFTLLLFVFGFSIIFCAALFVLFFCFSLLIFFFV